MDAEQVTLAGRTGAGKSTILKLLLGLYEPQGGEVLIHGRPAAAVREEEKRKLFGYVEQTFHMVPGTVRDQITLYDETIPADRVKAVAELTGLDDVIESSENGYDTKCTPELFSQGQWQLLSIARAAVAEPQMLLFDEITANLDAETEKAVLLALKRVAKDQHCHFHLTQNFSRIRTYYLSLIFLHKISNQVADDSNHHAIDGGNPPV